MDLSLIGFAVVVAFLWQSYERLKDINDHLARIIQLLDEPPENLVEVFDRILARRKNHHSQTDRTP